MKVQYSIGALQRVIPVLPFMALITGYYSTLRTLNSSLIALAGRCDAQGQAVNQPGSI